MAQRSNHLDWSQKLFVACFCTGSLVLGAGGAVKASRMLGGPAADMQASASGDKAAEPTSAEPTADDAAASEETTPPPAPTPTPVHDEDAAQVSDMAKPDKPGEHGGEKDPAREATHADPKDSGETLTESQRRQAFAAIALAKAGGEGVDEAISSYAEKHGLSKGQMDDIAEEGQMKGWSSGGEAKGDLDADAPDKGAE